MICKKGFPVRVAARHILTDKRILLGLVLVAALSSLAVYFLLTNPYTTVLPPFLLIAVIIVTISTSETELHVSLPYQVVIGVWLITGAATLVFYVTSGFSRMLPVHIGAVIWYGVCFFAAIALGKTSLWLITGTAVAHRGMQYYTSQIQIGHDALFHNQVAATITATGTHKGTALEVSKYYYSPWYHDAVAISSKILGTGVRDAAFLTISVLAVIIPVLTAYFITSYHWGEETAAIAAFLVTIGDFTISWAVRPQPTTFGYILFALGLWVLIKSNRARVRQYTSDRVSNWKGIIIAILFTILATHQISAFIFSLTLSLMACGLLLWSTPRFKDVSSYAGLGWVMLAVSWLITRYSGPEGDAPAFLPLMVVKLGHRLTRVSGREVALPDGPYNPAGASALSPLHTYGFALLIALAVVGGILWITSPSNNRQQEGFLLAIVGAGLATVALIGPAIGFSFLIPRRWFVFFYYPASILAAVGVVHLVSITCSLVPQLTHGHLGSLLPALIVILILTSGMSWNYPGSYDGPVFNDAPAAQRYSMTASETAGYEFAARYQGDRPIVSDFIATQFLNRYYRATALHTRFNDGELVYDRPFLILDRDYSSTTHASYYIHHRERWIRVYRNIDYPERNVIYSSNGERIRYVASTE